ncbi:hypothetical protein F4777DRAFT_596671 [Nemania sp. FL0916]|nr:hypothetical protein F4777DRAFT_596671 [Nemania sp. FL0916]
MAAESSRFRRALAPHKLLLACLLVILAGLASSEVVNHAAVQLPLLPTSPDISTFSPPPPNLSTGTLSARNAELQDSGSPCRFGLWNCLGSTYQVCNVSGIWSAEQGFAEDVVCSPLGTTYNFYVDSPQTTTADVDPDGMSERMKWILTLAFALPVTVLFTIVVVAFVLKWRLDKGKRGEKGKKGGRGRGAGEASEITLCGMDAEEMEMTKSKSKLSLV